MSALPAPHPAPAATLPAAVRLMGGLLVLVLLFVGWARWQGVSMHQADAPVQAQRLLRFVDGPGGAVLAIDATTGATIATFVGEQGFLRSTLRGLLRDRKREGLGSDTPVELVWHRDGRLTLRDPETGQRIDLESFGPDNMAVFAGLFSADARRPLNPR